MKRRVNNVSEFRSVFDYKGTKSSKCIYLNILRDPLKNEDEYNTDEEQYNAQLFLLVHSDCDGNIHIYIHYSFYYHTHIYSI